MNTHHHVTPSEGKSMRHRLSWAALLLALAPVLPIMSAHAQSDFSLGKKLGR